MFPKRANSKSIISSDTSPAPKKAPTPLISEEADKAINGVQLRYGMISFAVGVLVPVLLIIVGSRYTGTAALVKRQTVFAALSCLWFIPFYIGQTKQAALRLRYARDYAEQQRWGTVIAALRSFTEWGQKSFDRDGEAHYILAQAYDRTNRKDLARKAREFIRKHRSGSEWAKRIGPAPGALKAASIPSRAKSSVPSKVAASGAAGESAAAPKRSGQGFTKPARRKRF